MKRLVRKIRIIMEDLFGLLFALIAAPIIRLSGRSDLAPEPTQKPHKKEGN